MKQHLYDHAHGGTRVHVMIADDGSEATVFVTTDGEGGAEKPLRLDLWLDDQLPLAMNAVYAKRLRLRARRYDGPVLHTGPMRKMY